MSVIPIRMVNLIAASVLLKDVMAAVYDDVATNSTWVPTHQTDTTVPTGPGANSQTLQSPSGDIELNWKNVVSPAAPSATGAFLGINPDGSADPITDSESPWLSAANFSGVDGGFANHVTPGNVEFTWIEWGDAVMALFKNATRTFYPYGWHFGKVLLPAISAMANSGDIRMDGCSILPNLPALDANDNSWASTAGPIQRRRISIGQSVDTGDGILGAWGQPVSASRRIEVPIPATIDSVFKYGVSAERVVWPVTYEKQNANYNSDQGWMAKYLRIVPAIAPPGTIWRVGGDDQYLVIGNSIANSSLAIPMINGFNPTP